jgi:hypothetical protein
MLIGKRFINFVNILRIVTHSFIYLQVLICRNEAEKCLIETSINSIRISMKVLWRTLLDVSMVIGVSVLLYI